MEKKSGNSLWSKIIKFVMVGGSSTAIDFLTYLFLLNWIPMGWAKAAGMIIASLFSYLVNKRFTFQNKDKTDGWYLLRYYLVFAANLAVNVSVNSFVYWLTSLKLIAFVAATACGMVVNFCGQYLFVFNQKKRDEE